MHDLEYDNVFVKAILRLTTLLVHAPITHCLTAPPLLDHLVQALLIERRGLSRGVAA